LDEFSRLMTPGKELKIIENKGWTIQAHYEGKLGKRFKPGFITSEAGLRPCSLMP